MNSGYYPIVLNPDTHRSLTGNDQLPFYFGESSVPYDLALFNSHNPLYIRHSGIPNPLDKMRGLKHIEEQPKKPKRTSKKKKNV